MSRTPPSTRMPSRRKPAPGHVRRPRQHTPASMAQAMVGPDPVRTQSRPVASARPSGASGPNRPNGWVMAALALLGFGPLRGTAE